MPGYPLLRYLHYPHLPTPYNCVLFGLFIIDYLFVSAYSTEHRAHTPLAPLQFCLQLVSFSFSYRTVHPLCRLV